MGALSQRVAASSLSDIAKHSPELAQSVVDAGAVAYLAPLITANDSKLKRQVCSALGQVAKHSVDLAEVVVEAEIFPKILTCLKDVDPTVRKHAATCIREARAASRSSRLRSLPRLASPVARAASRGEAAAACAGGEAHA